MCIRDRGSGLQIGTVCSEDTLDRNWQRLILTHLLERKHPGVLTGSEITDMKITLVKGRAHIKHTEGGDFRQATYRAVRQGLKKAESVLLEPVYAFRLEIPSESTGRALNDIQRMYGLSLIHIYPFLHQQSAVWRRSRFSGNSTKKMKACSRNRKNGGVRQRQPPVFCWL